MIAPITASPGRPRNHVYSRGMAESNSAPPPSDRRGGERHIACFPAYVEREAGSPRASMIHDLSVTGALLLGRKELPPGERVRLQLFILDDQTQFHVATGKVVRTEPLDENTAGLWGYRIAVQFDEPLTMYEAEIRALREREERLRPT
jgi:PilZ domain